ncbi:MAG: hypothetical protein HeimC2_14380 [Candidatus Heimdallarchaeota archaeon LC_2]|nr:MAG: hypothetical protein HeimC2_14380 [Candidatus Heimdallarchaeota archaeon LC_2]
MVDTNSIDWNIVANLSIPIIGLTIAYLVYRYEMKKELREVRILLLETISRFQKTVSTDSNYDHVLFLIVGTFNALLKESSFPYEQYDKAVDEFGEKGTLSDFIASLSASVLNLRHKDLR